MLLFLSFHNQKLETLIETLMEDEEKKKKKKQKDLTEITD